ncbi:MAG: hypothetical protein SFW66_01230 [Gammaproteobacteria bacterium]|nr:hypothetical protein [Gammaproteobacteria bacterium]
MFKKTELNDAEIEARLFEIKQILSQFTTRCNNIVAQLIVREKDFWLSGEDVQIKSLTKEDLENFLPQIEDLLQEHVNREEEFALLKNELESLHETLISNGKTELETYARRLLKGNSPLFKNQFYEDLVWAKQKIRGDVKKPASLYKNMTIEKNLEDLRHEFKSPSEAKEPAKQPIQRKGIFTKKDSEEDKSASFLNPKAKEFSPKNGKP